MWYGEQTDANEAPTFPSMVTHASRSKGSVLAGLGTDVGQCHHLHALWRDILLPLDLEVIILSHHDGGKFTHKKISHSGSAKVSTLKFTVAEFIPGVWSQGVHPYTPSKCQAQTKSYSLRVRSRYVSIFSWKIRLCSKQTQFSILAEPTDPKPYVTSFLVLIQSSLSFRRPSSPWLQQT